jgi:hypothetical protein
LAQISRHKYDRTFGKLRNIRDFFGKQVPKEFPKQFTIRSKPYRDAQIGQSRYQHGLEGCLATWMKVSDLLPDHDLVIFRQNPRKCGHRLRLNRFEAAERFGGDLLLSDLGRRAKCGACGYVGAMTIVLMLAGRGANYCGSRRFSEPKSTSQMVALQFVVWTPADQKKPSVFHSGSSAKAMRTAYTS